MLGRCETWAWHDSGEQTGELVTVTLLSTRQTRHKTQASVCAQGHHYHVCTNTEHETRNTQHNEPSHSAVKPAQSFIFRFPCYDQRKYWVLRLAMSNVCVSNEEQSSSMRAAASSHLITCLNWLVLVWENTELLTSSQFTPSRGQLTESGGAVAPHNIWQLFCRKYLTILIVYAPRCCMLLNQTCKWCSE